MCHTHNRLHLPSHLTQTPSCVSGWVGCLVSVEFLSLSFSLLLTLKHEKKRRRIFFYPFFSFLLLSFGGWKHSCSLISFAISLNLHVCVPDCVSVCVNKIFFFFLLLLLLLRFFLFLSLAKASLNSLGRPPLSQENGREGRRPFGLHLSLTLPWSEIETIFFYVKHLRECFYSLQCYQCSPFPTLFLRLLLLPFETTRSSSFSLPCHGVPSSC